ncbi:MAG: type II toxin-antitoxin system VapC family toxin [Prolixibacteraceae bacterium]|nr:type II toxin-antitoxin system VapC family toxin [Prolixibacteraceae bacterium]
MNYLLDTHTLIRFLSGDDKLSHRSKEIIENQDNSKFISIATIWEIAIKLSLDKFKFEKGFKEFLNLIGENGFDIIPITFDNALIVSTLKFIHRDPFDRLIVAQAMTDNLTIITRDEFIERYDVKIIW